MRYSSSISRHGPVAPSLPRIALTPHTPRSRITKLAGMLSAAITMSFVPPMNHTGIDGGGRSLTRSWLRSRLRYQLTGPKNPLASNEST